MTWQWVAIILGLALNFTIIFVAVTWKGANYADEQQPQGGWGSSTRSEKRFPGDEAA